MASESVFQKGFGNVTPEQISGATQPKLNLLHEDLSLPAAILVAPRMEHNLRWMAEFVRDYGVLLAPHGKTTMAARLFARQIDAGAWGMTLATAQQCAVAHAHGIQRILMANELVGRANCELVSQIIAEGTTFYTLVDSPDLVHQLGTFFKAKGQRLRVLLELGADGGRAGARNDEQIKDIVTALQSWQDTLLLCGIEVYEGILKDEQSVRAFLTRAVDTLQHLREQNAFAAGERILLSGAGSAWYDVVAEVFSPVKQEVDVVLRPGCYLTSDAGIYRIAQKQINERNATARKIDEELHGTLRPALEVWAYVQSRPEPNLIIVGLGKRDAAFDAGLPTAIWHYRPGIHTKPVSAPIDWETTKVMDQHAYLQVPSDADLKVGDMLGFEISHPCLTFDKWRYISLVDAGYNILEAIPTYF